MADIILKYVTLDVFTSVRFTGNPLAIVHIPRGISKPLSQELKQKIAKEFNFSETVFVHDGTSPAKIDIFTPWTEIPFAGHPTIGSICHLMEAHPDANALLTKAGLIPSSYDKETRLARAQIPHDVHIHQAPLTLSEMLKGQPGLHNVRSRLPPNGFPVVSIVKGMTFAVIELPDEEILSMVKTTPINPNIILDEGPWKKSLVGCYFFVRGNHDPEAGSLSLRTRCIAESIEDPATGSAASALTAWLSIDAKTPRTEFHYKLVQGLEMGRRSEIEIRIKSDESGQGIDSLTLMGQAIVVSEGQLWY